MMSMWNNVRAFLFGHTRGAHDPGVRLVAEEKLIGYLFNLINREDLVVDEVKEHEKIGELVDTRKKGLAYAKLYFQLENFLIDNGPLVTKKEFADKKELHADIRRQALVDGLSTPLKLIFSGENEQAAELYNIALPELIAYTRHTLGETELASILAAATQGTLLEHAELQDDSFAIEKSIAMVNAAPLSEVTFAFKKVYKGLLERITAVFGEKASATAAKEMYDTIAENFDQGLLSLFLNILPEGFLETQKLFVLSREDLEKRVLEATAALEEEKEGVERKVVERTQELKKKVEELHVSNQLLSQREQELVKANVELQKLDQRKSEFLSVVAHQLRTPLSGIKWALNILLQSQSKPLSEEQKKLILLCDKGNERMILIVNEMLHADRIEGGTFELTLVATDLTALIVDVIEELRLTATERAISITFTHDTHIPILMIDQEMMHFAFQNLLDNAIKYSPLHGTVEMRVEVSGAQVICSITDHGIGIPLDQQPYIFSRFFRAKNAISTQPNGNGLGLFIVKGILEKHGGTIWFTSEENKGTTFHCVFNHTT